MKKLLFIFFTIQAFFLYAQKTDSKFSIGVFISPGSSYRTLTYDGASFNDSEGKMIVEALNDRERPKFSYNSGVIINYSINKRFILSSGISFLNVGEKESTGKLRFGSQIHPRLGFIFDSNFSDVPTSIKFYYNYYFIQIPLKVKIVIGENKFQGFFGSGLSFDKYLTNRSVSYITYDNGEIERESNKDTRGEYTNINFSSHLDIGVAYSINPKLKLFINPNFIYMFSPVANSLIERRPYSLGIATGINLNL